MEEKKTEEPQDAADTGSTEGESLENADDQAAGGGITDTTAGGTGEIIADQTPQKESFIKRLWHKLNIYFLLFIFILLVSGGFAAVLYLRNKNIVSSSTIDQQKISSDTLQKLASNGIQVGDPKQVLNIQSNSVFGGTVLVKGELQVAGGLKIGSGDLAISDVNINGSATVNQLQAQTAAIAGGVAIQGQLSVQKDLSVSGNGTFNGSVTAPQFITAKLQLTGDLTLSRHIIAGGGIPSRTNGTALGTGGTTSIGGSDTGGAISISTGGSPAAGCFISVNFVNPFTAAPRVIVTPVGSSAAGLAYYVTRTSTSFSLCTATPAPANAQFGFDYIIFN